MTQKMMALLDANGYATAAHDAMVRARAAAWAMRKACKHDNPEAWKDLCQAIRDATDAAGKCMDITANPFTGEPLDEEERTELVRETQWMHVG